jgi:Domain of unknown function (DUF397)
VSHPNNPTWRKSSYSSGSGAECVEVSRTPDTAHLRDSKNTTGPALSFNTSAWHAMLTTVDRPA